MQPLKNLLPDLPTFQKEVPRPQNEVKDLVQFYCELRGFDKLPKAFWKSKEAKDPKYSYARNMADAKQVLEFWTLLEAKELLFQLKSESKLYDYDWRLSTIIKQGVKKHETKT